MTLLLFCIKIKILVPFCCCSLQYIVYTFCYHFKVSFCCKTVLQANPGVVTTLDNRMHGLQTGDNVTFKEIVGMTALNGSEQTVKG